MFFKAGFIIITLLVIGMGLGVTVGSTAEKKPTIAIVYPIVHPFFEETTRGALEAGKEFGANIITMGPDTPDIAKQITIMEGLIAQRVSGIAIGVLDPKGLTPVINKAIERGIPVLTFDTDAPESKRLAYIGTNNIEAGKHAGREMVRILGGKGKICISMGVPTQLNLIQRVEGFKEVISKYPEMQIIDMQTGYGDPEKTLANIENMLQAHPDMDALFGVDAQAGPSAVVAWRAKKVRIPIVTFDDLPDILKGVEEGIITVTIVQRQYKWGYLGVKYLLDALAGKKIPPVVDTGTVAVTKENVKTYKNIP